MKYFWAVLLSIAFFAFTLHGGVIDAEYEEKITLLKSQSIAEYSEIHNISKDDIKDIVNHARVADNEEEKCGLSCVMKKLGIMKDGKLDWELCMLILGFTNDGDKAKVEKIVEICQAEVPTDETDECRLAYSMAVCKIKHLNEFDLHSVHLDQ